MVFRKESRADSFQRQISALRQQLGTDGDDDVFDDAEPMPEEAEQQQQAAPPAVRTPATRPQPTRTAQVPDAAIGVIAADSVWSGTLRSQGSLQIYGQVEGDLAASNEIFVADGAIVNAKISARTIIVAGAVDGIIICDERLEVMPTGRISGDISSPSLVVLEGATVDGELQMPTQEESDE